MPDDLSGVADAVKGVGNGTWHVARFALNQTNEVTVAMEALNFGEANRNGGSCGFNTGEFVVVCGGVNQSIPPRTAGSVVSSPYSQAEMDTSSSRLLAHEVKHSDQQALLGPMFWPMYLLDAGAGWCSGNPKGAECSMFFEWWASRGDGGYSC